MYSLNEIFKKKIQEKQVAERAKVAEEAKGKGDAFLAENGFSRTGTVVDPGDWAGAIRQRRKALLQRFDQILLEMREDGSFDKLVQQAVGSE